MAQRKTKMDPKADEQSQPDDELSKDASGELEKLRAELDLAVEARKRALADFANFQRRASENEVRAVREGAARVTRSLLGVLDHFDLALDQDTTQLSVEQLLGGVRIVRDELIKALLSHGVTRVDPEIGEDFDPNRHEAVFRQPSPDIEPNHIVSVLQPGYTIGEMVLRPAKVAVAAPPEVDENEG